jgi:AcrR family transcriptional regulator
MKPRQRRSQADRSASAQIALVAAASAVLAERGFGRATTSGIAEQAGVTTGALHHHFATKEDLFIAVLDDVSARVLQLLVALEERPGEDLASTLIEALWSVYGGGQYWAVWEINIGWRSDPVLTKRLSEHREMVRKHLNEAIADNPALSPHAKTTILAMLPFVLSTIRGLFLETFTSSDKNFFVTQIEILKAVLRDRLAADAAIPRRVRAAR